MATIPKIAADAGMSLSDRAQYQKRLAELEAAQKARIAIQKKGEAVSGGLIDKINYSIFENPLSRGVTAFGSATAAGIEQGMVNIGTGTQMLRYGVPDGDPLMILSGIEQIAQGALTLGAGWGKAASSALAFVPKPIRDEAARYFNSIAQSGKFNPLPKKLVEDLNNAFKKKQIKQ